MSLLFAVAKISEVAKIESRKTPRAFPWNLSATRVAIAAHGFSSWNDMNTTLSFIVFRTLAPPIKLIVKTVRE